MSVGGKGSSPRPLSVTQHEYDTRWDAIFGRDQVSESIAPHPPVINTTLQEHSAVIVEVDKK